MYRGSLHTEFQPYLLLCFQNTDKGRTIIFLEGGMKNIEKNCLQGLERLNKLFAKMICITKNSKKNNGLSLI